MNCYNTTQTDYGPAPYVADIAQKAVDNQNFRVAVWTGEYMQMTLMSIPAGEEIGLEIHCDTDQLIRVEQGSAVVRMGKCQDRLDIRKNVCCGDVIFVPAGIWHNVINTGRTTLKVSSVYAPSHHPRGTLQQVKE